MLNAHWKKNQKTEYHLEERNFLWEIFIFFSFTNINEILFCFIFPKLKLLELQKMSGKTVSFGKIKFAFKWKKLQNCCETIGTNIWTIILFFLFQNFSLYPVKFNQTKRMDWIFWRNYFFFLNSCASCLIFCWRKKCWIEVRKKKAKYLRQIGIYYLLTIFTSHCFGTLFGSLSGNESWAQFGIGILLLFGQFLYWTRIGIIFYFFSNNLLNLIFQYYCNYCFFLVPFYPIQHSWPDYFHYYFFFFIDLAIL